MTYEQERAVRAVADAAATAGLAVDDRHPHPDCVHVALAGGGWLTVHLPTRNVYMGHGRIGRPVVDGSAFKGHGWAGRLMAAALKGMKP